MSGLTIYNAYIPTLSSTLDTLEAILNKAQAYATEKGIDVDTEYATASLHEDMKPLTFQVQVIEKMTQLASKVATGNPAGPWTDETTFEQLFAQIKRARETLKSINPEDVNSKQGQVIDCQVGGNTRKMSPEAYLSCFVLPNAYFHLQTTYAILRMKGVPLGKMDFLTSFLA